MKTKFYTLILLALTYTVNVEAKTVNKAVTNNANWSSAGTWSQNRIPASGDSVVIPSGFSIWLDINATLSNVAVTIVGTLTIDTHSSLVLDNTSAVYIPTGGKLSSSAGSATSLISIGGTNKFVGSTDGTIHGPATANKSTGTSPLGFNFGTLPVTWVSFTAIRTGEAVLLKWNTVNEKNNSHFEIERSPDGSSWTMIGTVAAGTEGAEDSYSYTDEMAGAAQVEYRLRQVDLDDQSEYSKVVTVSGNTTTAAATTTTIFAAGKTVNVRFAEPINNRVTVRLVSIGGQVLQQETIEAASSTTSMSASNLPAGIYVVYLADGKGWSTAQKVML